MCAHDPSFLRACCLLLCFVAGTRQLSISEFVVPKVVEAGNDVELQCSYELGSNSSEKGIFVKWWWTPPPSSNEERQQLYQRGPDHKPYSMQHKIDIDIKENDTIILSDVKPIASGIYECEVSEIEEDRRHQELIVYSKGSGPQLNVSEVEDGPDEDQDVDVRIECTTDDTSPLPRLVISINGEVVNSTEIVSGPDEMGFYDAFANWTASKNDVDGADIRCELFFDNVEIVHSDYVDTEVYHPSGAEVSTAEPTDQPPEAGATPDSLQNSPGAAGKLQVSASLLSSMAAIGYAILLF